MVKRSVLCYIKISTLYCSQQYVAMFFTLSISMRYVCRYNIPKQHASFLQPFVWCKILIQRAVFLFLCSIPMQAVKTRAVFVCPRTIRTIRAISWRDTVSRDTVSVAVQRPARTMAMVPAATVAVDTVEATLPHRRLAASGNLCPARVSCPRRCQPSVRITMRKRCYCPAMTSISKPGPPY